MFKVREARKLAEKIFFMEVEAPRLLRLASRESSLL